MKYGIFGDVHGNLEALQAVLQDMEEQGVKKFICLGDIVGYNANPRQCLETIRNLECLIIRGNHDEAASWSHDPAHFNPMARDSIRFTRSELDPAQLEYLGLLPLYARVGSLVVVHAELVKPDSWGYLLCPAEAAASLKRLNTSIGFFGHTHIPHMFVEDSRGVREYFYSKFQLHPQKKYFVNVGSVGQPRDEDWRSAYVIYDDVLCSVELRRISYDVATAQSKILRAGLHSLLAERLGPKKPFEG